MLPMVATRRTLLQGLAASAVTCTHLWAPRSARASDLALSDRIDLLYSNQFHFNRRGEPQVTVGLVEGRTRVVLSAHGGIQVLPSGDGGTIVEVGDTIEVRLASATPATVSFAIVLEELQGPRALRPEPALERWRERGFSPYDEEVGTVFGVAGHVLDNRRIRVLTGRFSSETEALAEAQRLKERFGALGTLHVGVQQRARGSMVARDLQRDVAIRAEGVLWFAPRGKGPLRLQADDAKNQLREYWGNLYVAVDRSGKLAVANLVSETDLLSGLVPAEIYASAPMAALEAQAVAARGQLVSKVGTRHLGDPFLLCAAQHCQVYAGRALEHPRTSQAVRATQGWVAMRPAHGQLVDTVYSANCGGHTEDNEVVWPGAADPQLRGQPDLLLASRFPRGIPESGLHDWLLSAPETYSRPPRDIPQEPYRWTTTVDPTVIAGRSHVPASLGTVKRLDVLARGKSGRATHVRLHGPRATFDLHGELRIRRALGDLRSSLFIVDAPDRFGRFVLHGGGHGHGVGMCQHGAMGMARAGKDWKSILRHYYRGAELVELW